MAAMAHGNAAGPPQRRHWRPTPTSPTTITTKNATPGNPPIVPAAFRKLDAVAVLTGPSLSAPRHGRPGPLRPGEQHARRSGEACPGRSGEALRGAARGGGLQQLVLCRISGFAASLCVG